MNAPKNSLTSGRGGIQKARYLDRLFVAFVLVVAMAFLLGTPGAWSETYTSFGSNYPSKFGHGSSDDHNDAHYMDAVYFGGKEIYFFTLISNVDRDPSYSSYLYFYANDPKNNTPSYSGTKDIQNTSALDFRIKLVAMGEVLYVFYTAATSANNYDTSTIYYRTAKVDHGTTGTDWKLSFSEKKSFSAGGSPVEIRAAQLMNDTIYVIYKAGNDWYSMSSADGQNFGSRTHLFYAPTIKGFGAAVFQVPAETEGSVDKMMIAYTDTAYTLYYGFFDGQTVYGAGTTIETSGLKPASVRLIAGSAQEYSNSKYSIQVFITHNQDDWWHPIYHSEYIPAGVKGNEGTWSSTWNKLSKSGDDAVHCYPSYESDSGWAVIPFFTSADASAGTFTLTFKGQTTTALAYNATAAQVETALNSLSMIGGVGGSVKVGLSGNVYTVTFGGSLANTDVDQVFSDGSGGTSALVATKTNGSSSSCTTNCVSEVQTVTVSKADVQMYVRLWYAKGTHYYTWEDQVNTRCSSYQSDLLAYQGRTSVSAGQQDLNTSTVLGVIEGTPPYPVNGGVEKVETNETSTVELEATADYEASTAWTVGSSVTVAFGKKFEEKGGLKAKLSFGLEYTKGSTQSATATGSDTLQNFTHETTGDMGWVLVLKPEIINDKYVLKAWDGSGLSYGTDTTVDQVMASVINYGSGTELVFAAYYLQDPSAPIAGNPPDTYPEIFKGMVARPLSTDVVGWQTVVNTNDPNYKVAYKLPMVSGTSGEKSKITIVQTTTNTTTQTNSAGFSASVKLLGFIDVGWEGTVDYSMDFETKTSLEKSLGWNYNMPECSTEKCCVGLMDIENYLLVPNDDASGYNAPWISDDIRTYQKPKPWCLSYISTPSHNCSTGVDYVKLTVDKAQGILFLDESEPNHDSASAHLTLKGVASNFSLKSMSGEQLVHMRLGNYIVNSNRNYVLSRSIQGNNLILRLKESEDSGSFITVRLSYNKAKSRLDIDLDADRIDLTGLYAYPFLGTEESSGSEAKRVPFRLFLGDKYYAEGDLDVRCAVNNQNAICELHIK